MKPKGMRGKTDWYRMNRVTSHPRRAGMKGQTREGTSERSG